MNTINTGVKMFTYLNLCPPNMMIYFKELLSKATLKEIILTTSAIIKDTVMGEKKAAVAVLNKIGQTFKLHYKSIGLLTKNNMTENSSRNCLSNDCSQILEILGSKIQFRLI